MTITAERHATLDRAFKFVCPAEHARRLAAKGLLGAQDAASVSWKDPICSLVTERDLAAAGLTIDDIVEAVMFYTATPAVVRAAQIGSDDCGVKFNEPVSGWMVMADGYSAGPAR